MEKYLTIDEYMDTFFGLGTTIAAFGSLYFVWKGYNLAKDYLKQHESKKFLEIRIEFISKSMSILSEFIEHNLASLLFPVKIEKIINLEDPDLKNLLDRVLKKYEEKHLKDPNNLNNHITLDTYFNIIANENVLKEWRELNDLINILESLFKELINENEKNNLHECREIITKLPSLGKHVIVYTSISQKFIDLNNTLISMFHSTESNFFNSPQDNDSK